jgi:hypothetical protein
MDILASAVRRLIASIGAMGALAVRIWKFLSHLIFLEERRRLEHLRNENLEIQNMQAYEKLLAQYAKLTLSLGRDPRDVDAMLSALRYARLGIYLKLNAIPDTKGSVPRPVTGNSAARKIDPPFINRRYSERRITSDRRES